MWDEFKENYEEIYDKKIKSLTEWYLYSNVLIEGTGEATVRRAQFFGPLICKASYLSLTYLTLTLF